MLSLQSLLVQHLPLQNPYIFSDPFTKGFCRTCNQEVAGLILSCDTYLWQVYTLIYTIMSSASKSIATEIL